MVVAKVGHVQVAAGVERQGNGIGQTGGVRGAGCGAARRELAHRRAVLVGHVQVAAGVKRQGGGIDKPAEYVALAVVLPGANLLTVLLPSLATYRLPLESNAKALGPDKPAETSR